jgi:RNA polymerase sigma-70 factor, ECF subfamily
MTHTEEIKLLVGRCLEGDKESYGEIVRFYQQKIYDLCYHYLGTRQDAEDAAAEVFIKGYRSLSSFDPQYAFATWLYKIAVNHAIGILRKQKRERQYLSTQNSNPLWVIEAEAPESVFFNRSQDEMFQKALEMLPVKYRTTLMLKYHHDLSYKEIGNIMELPVNTVGSLVLRAKQELRKIIKRGENHGMSR